MGNLERRRGAADGSAPTPSSGDAALPVRTERDLSMRVVLFGSLALLIAIALAPVLDINPLAAVLIMLFGFFFVTVSSASPVRSAARRTPSRA